MIVALPSILFHLPTAQSPGVLCYTMSLPLAVSRMQVALCCATRSAHGGDEIQFLDPEKQVRALRPEVAVQMHTSDRDM